MTSRNNFPFPPPERYPGFRAEEIAAATLAARAAALAAQERNAALPEPEDPSLDPLAAVLENYSRIQENGCPPEQAQIELILFSYFDTAGKILAREMGGDYDRQPNRYVALAMMEYLNTRMSPENEPLPPENPATSSDPAAGQASAGQGAE